jgi:aryl sulfotransferase
MDMPTTNHRLNAWTRPPREVRNHTLDSTRWYDFAYRHGDIVIGTWAKTGTTWVQQIVGQLIFNGATGIPVYELSPWIEQRFLPKTVMLARLDKQSHRRFVKTHLPADALMFSPDVKYLYIGRDGRDVLWSLYDHHKNLAPVIYDMTRRTPRHQGPSFSPPAADIRQYFHDWLDKDGFPLWPFWSHVQSWWDLRERPNVLLLHFDALKADLPGQIRRIARFLEIEIDAAAWPHILEHCSFTHMKEHAATLSKWLDRSFVGGARVFFNKGTGKRWVSVLSAADIEKYEDAARKNLSAECARWLSGQEALA